MEKSVIFFKKHKIRIVLTACVLFLAVAFGVLFGFVQTHQLVVANFTDEVVRPLIGNKATINLESMVFSLQDSGKRLEYTFASPDTHIFMDIEQSASLAARRANSSFTLFPIPPLSQFFPMGGEGIWDPIDTGTEQIAMAKTFVRPDAERSYAIVALVKINMSLLMINGVAGIKEPGGPGNPGPGIVPKYIQNSNTLLAAFDGGFLKKDGYYGMIVGNHIYQPLQKDMATFVIHQNGQTQIVKYGGQSLGSDILVARQNGPMLIENEQIVTSSKAWNMQTWGLTTTNTMYTWRSGIGVTKEGNLIYAVGPSLVPDTLAKALKAGGAVSAMQLDINPAWARFVLFHSLGQGRYVSTALVKDMVNGGYQYLSGYQKDFFYIYKKY